jgi:acetyl esterase
VTSAEPRTYRFDQDLADVVAFAATLPPRTPENLQFARARLEDGAAALNPTVDLSGLTVEDKVIGGHVPVRVYRPDAPVGLLPAVLYIHGGGFSIGSIESEHAPAARLAREAQAIVVSVGYRLAPEHPFPAGLDDCFAALEWIGAEGPGLSVDPAYVAVHGSSAGGCLAAAIALLARDRGGPALCFQFLGIPVLDDRLDTPSMRAFVDTPMWNRPNAAISWQLYLGSDPGEVSPYAAPARAKDLAGLPPAYISTMEFDPLRDEGMMYARRLLEAGVSVELHQFPGTFHGSSMAPAAESSKRLATESLFVMRRALHRAT